MPAETPAAVTPDLSTPNYGPSYGETPVYALTGDAKPSNDFGAIMQESIAAMGGVDVAKLAKPEIPDHSQLFR